MRRTKTRKPQSVGPRFLLILLVAIAAISGAAIYSVSRPPRSQTATTRVPHFFASAESAKPFPATLQPRGISNHDVVAAYQAAKQIPEALAQQPCYCYCDRRGHRSLLDCFGSKHGSECDICVKEALFAMQEHRKGRSPEQIRAGIIHGDWKTIQLQD